MVKYTVFREKFTCASSNYVNNDVTVYKEYKHCALVFVSYVKSMLTEAHLLKCLLRLISISGRNEETSRSFLEYGYFEFSNFTK